jgi:hypothetical protein
MAAKVSQQLDLAQGALGQDLLAEDIGNLLDSDALVRLVVYGGTASWSCHGQRIWLRANDTGRGFETQARRGVKRR